MMKIIGMSYTTNQNNIRNYTLHVQKDFESYYFDSSNNRDASGYAVEIIYVGDYSRFTDRQLEVGDEIEVYYSKAVATKNGGYYQPISKIEVL